MLTQMLFGLEILDTSEIRQLTLSGSLSGAILGGAMFGAVMILARGCLSRMLMLAGQGNLRAVLNRLVFAVAAQASLRGFLHPVRDEIAGAWVVSGDALDVLGSLGQGWDTGMLLGGLWLAAAVYFAVRSGLTLKGWLGGNWRWDHGGSGLGLDGLAQWAIVRARKDRKSDLHRSFG